MTQFERKPFDLQDFKVDFVGPSHNRPEVTEPEPQKLTRFQRFARAAGNFLERMGVEYINGKGSNYF